MAGRAATYAVVQFNSKEETQFHQPSRCYPFLGRTGLGGRPQLRAEHQPQVEVMGQFLEEVVELEEN